MNLEKERLKLELKRVQLAKEEMEYTILERLADIERLKANIQNQDKRVMELKAKIAEGEK